jgi:hypothetical protein
MLICVCWIQIASPGEKLQSELLFHLKKKKEKKNSTDNGHLKNDLSLGGVTSEAGTYFI